MESSARAGKLYIFDMDGTLFQTEAVAVPSFRRALAQLARRGVEIPAGLSDRDITGALGHTHELIWKHLLGHLLPEDLRQEIDRELMEDELASIRRGDGRLYPGVTVVLEQLFDAGARLFVASNGQQRYVEGIVDHFGIRRLFTGLYSAAGAEVANKSALVRMICRKYPDTSGVMVGDRASDVL
ncbi:MAG: HAD family hydrolase, partial [Firmicutes bacterium]|nr:HAD family hydrolase [Bacillota bacterium]